MSVNIPQLTIEMEEDGTVLLEQEWCGESDRIQLHPIHGGHWLPVPEHPSRNPAPVRPICQ